MGGAPRPLLKELPAELAQRASERRLARIWREEAPRLPALECDDGSRLRVLYPGRPSTAAGPDFRDAILQHSDGRLVQGDVELHLKQGDWKAHGHHRDRRYNGVVLHVVLYPTGEKGAATRLEMEARVPTAALFPVLARRSDPRRRWRPGPMLPLFGGAPEGLGSLLGRAGDARFQAKVAAFRRSLSMTRDGGTPREGLPQERLYQGLMEALGYSRNRAPFLHVAHGMPLTLLERVVGGVGPSKRAHLFQALLLGGRGF